jgi:predicted ATPase
VDSQGTRGLRLTSLYLENWRNFRKVDAELTRRAFIIGPNASGKSNLIDAFRFLNELVIVGGGFRYAVGRPERGGVSSLRCLAARQYSDITIRITIGTDADPEQWSYSLSFNQDNNARPIVRHERAMHHGSLVLERPTREDQDDPERLAQTFLEQVNVNRDFRPISEFLENIQYLHIVPQLIRDPDRSAGLENDPFGGDFLEQIAQTNDRTRQSRLRRINQALRVAVPQLSELELYRDGRGRPHLRGRYEHWRPQGAWQNEALFSDGTLRLIGLLWALMGGKGPLLLEEPELSLHPEVVRHLPRMFNRVQRKSSRQILLSTHSSDLLSDPGIGLDEVLLLMPSKDGTEVRSASTFDEIEALVHAGVGLPEIALGRTRPKDAEQLSMFQA